MHLRHLRLVSAPRLRVRRANATLGVYGPAALAWAFALFPLSASPKAADAANDEFSAMRVRRIAPAIPAGKLVLRATDGRSIRLSDFRGKAVLVEFFLTN